jgi:hypothetical protein
MSRRSSLETSSRITDRLLEYDNEAKFDRRDRSRIQAQEPASVSAVRSKITCDATITEVSARGMRLIATRHFPVGRHSLLNGDVDSSHAPCVTSSPKKAFGSSASKLSVCQALSGS